jgi:hypothetical protein
VSLIAVKAHCHSINSGLTKQGLFAWQVIVSDVHHPGREATCHTYLTGVPRQRCQVQMNQIA